MQPQPISSNKQKKQKQSRRAPPPLNPPMADIQKQSESTFSHNKLFIVYVYCFVLFLLVGI